MDLLSLGLKTTLLGMSIVFICLFILMIIINLTSFFTKKSKSKAEEKTEIVDTAEVAVVQNTSAPTLVVSTDSEDEEVAAIAAVLAYLESEDAGGCLGTNLARKHKKDFDPWTYSGRQDLTNSRL